MSWKYYQKNALKISTERAYALLRRPLVTEKATMGSESNQVSFEVAMDATKAEIKASIEKVFSVKVEAVSVSILKGKVKKFKGISGKRKDRKKAIVKLAEGDSIDIGSTL